MKRNDVIAKVNRRVLSPLTQSVKIQENNDCKSQLLYTIFYWLRHCEYTKKKHYYPDIMGITVLLDYERHCQYWFVLCYVKLWIEICPKFVVWNDKENILTIQIFSIADNFFPGCQAACLSCVQVCVTQFVTKRKKNKQKNPSTAGKEFVDQQCFSYCYWWRNGLGLLFSMRLGEQWEIVNVNGGHDHWLRSCPRYNLSGLRHSEYCVWEMIKFVGYHQVDR